MKLSGEKLLFSSVSYIWFWLVVLTTSTVPSQTQPSPQLLPAPEDRGPTQNLKTSNGSKKGVGTGDKEGLNVLNRMGYEQFERKGTWQCRKREIRCFLLFVGKQNKLTCCGGIVFDRQGSSGLLS